MRDMTSDEIDRMYHQLTTRITTIDQMPAPVAPQPSPKTGRRLRDRVIEGLCLLLIAGCVIGLLSTF